MKPLSELSKPFSSTAVHWRVGSTTGDKSKGMALAYIDARDVMDRLDDVCGPDRWQSRYPNTSGRVICEIGIRVGDDWIWKADGAGDTAVEKEKGGISDAFKRAAVAWGIGRYLYSLKAPWVELETYKDRNNNVKVKGFTKSAMRDLVNIHQRATGGSVEPEPNAPTNDAKPMTKAKARKNGIFDRLCDAVRKLETLVDVEKWEADPRVIDARKSLPPDWARSLSDEILTHQNSIMDKQSAA